MRARSTEPSRTPSVTSKEAMPLTATPGQETAAPARRPHQGALSTCTLRHASDDGLVALTRAGSERAFAEIMRRYQRPLQFYCLHLVGAPRAEDAVQQAFMQAFISLRDGARREIALRPWLYRIARNCAIDLLRKQPFDHDQLDPEFDGVPQTPGVFEQKEELARIVAAIQALPEGQRRALTLRELEGRSYGEISAELGHTDSGVRQLIFRARTTLRNLGALIFPLDSVRWRLLGSSPAAIGDPHQVAAAATVSSTGGGNVLQAAASAVAATVTLLATGAAPERHASHTPAQPRAIVSATQQLQNAWPSLGATVAPRATSRHKNRASHGSLAKVTAPPTALSNQLIPVAVPLAAPGPAQPSAMLPVDPPSVVTIADPAAVPAVAVLGAPAGASGTVSGDAANAPSDRSSPTQGSPAVTPGDGRQTATIAKPSGTPPAKPVSSPVKSNSPSKGVATPSSPKLPATPKLPSTPKATTPVPAKPKKPAAPKAPASPPKPTASRA
jgi:RNA polymerase sigma factor (sigma-70 family)